MTRHLTFEAIENFRDFGDYPARGGRRVKRGRLWRSASHARASDADLAALAALELALVADLRRKRERLREPSRRHAGFAALVIENDRDDPRHAPWTDFIRTSDLSEEAVSGYMRGYARAAPFEPSHVELFSRYFRALGEADGPSLIHCAAGKDRTGLLAALTHHVLGVHRDDMIADYLLTNLSSERPERLESAAKAIEAAVNKRPTEAAVRAAVGVKPEYLEGALDGIAEAHGSVDAYLDDVLGVDAALREALEARLLD
jgi:protein tyrosine/serine phosphatase